MRDTIESTLQMLCRLPHRGSTTPFERRAAERIAETWERMGYTPALERFHSHTSFGWVFAIIYGLFALAGLSGLVWPSFGLIVGLLATALFYGETSTLWTPLARLVPNGNSQNLVAEVGPDYAGRTVVLMAHYDTSRSGAAFSPKQAPKLRALFLLGIVMIKILLLGLLLGALGLQGWLLDWMLIVPAVYYFYAVALMLEREFRGVLVNGANDNGSGVAALTAVAEDLQRDPPQTMKVYMVATGCEEVGMVGAQAFRQSHGSDLIRERTMIFNFDNLGAAKLCYVDGEGIVAHYPAGPEWLRLAQRVASEEEFKGKIGPYTYKALTLDTLPFAARGYDCMSIMALDEKGVPPNWHWPTDVLDNVNRENIVTAAGFAVRMLRELDRE